MKELYQYGGKKAEVENASGISGILCKSYGGSYFFRVYHQDKSFSDYDLVHDDLPITIDQNALASFYTFGEDQVLDHSPQVLGLEESE